LRSSSLALRGCAWCGRASISERSCRPLQSVSDLGSRRARRVKPQGHGGRCVINPPRHWAAKSRIQAGRNDDPAPRPRISAAPLCWSAAVCLQVGNRFAGPARARPSICGKLALGGNARGRFRAAQEVYWRTTRGSASRIGLFGYGMAAPEIWQIVMETRKTARGGQCWAEMMIRPAVSAAGHFVRFGPQRILAAR